MAVAGFYRRALPSPPAVEFSSPEGKMLFAEALGERTMEGFFKLISYYQTQSEPAYCGLTTLAMVLNALSIDPGRKWKGPWRWFDDSMLDCCEPLAKIKAKGITFGKVACLARCNGAKVVALRANESTIDEFREKVVLCTSSQDCHIITSYNRKFFKQTGSGHFSPIGGFHSGKDMVLILDVARFKYPPHWVPLSLLWDAMNTIDEATGQLRGYMILSKLSGGPSILYTVSCEKEGWNNVIEYLTEKLPFLLKTNDVEDIEDALSVAFQSPPRDLTEFIKWVAEVRRQEDGSVILSEEEKRRLEIKGNILKQLRETELFKRVTRWLDSRRSFSDSFPSLPEMAASVCCQGAGSLAGKFYYPDQMCCTRTDVNLLKAEGDDNPKVLVSGTVVSNGTQQGVDMLLPLCNSDTLVSSDDCCCQLMLPSMADFMTILVLFLPRITWSGIKEESVLVQINRLVSTDNLPSLLQEEVPYFTLASFLLKSFLLLFWICFCGRFFICSSRCTSLYPNLELLCLLNYMPPALTAFSAASSKSSLRFFSLGRH